ncbi:MAG TPA: hypothetical protein VLN59_03295 [Burkholderiales bacterium]|nr:hypothetical protein [Burkholderiales bacterium]
MLVVVFVLLPGTRVNYSTGIVVHAAGSAPQSAQTMPMGMPMQDMMKMHEKMMADMKASQTKLDDLAKKMNSTTGEAKVNAMAELLNEFVRDHKMMGDHMASMHDQMMKMGK